MAGEEGGHTDTRDTEVSDACTVVVVRISNFENVCELSSIISWDALLFSFLSGDIYMHGAIRCFFMGWCVCVGRVEAKTSALSGIQTNTFKQI